MMHTEVMSLFRVKGAHGVIWASVGNSDWKTVSGLLSILSETVLLRDPTTFSNKPSK